MFKRLDRVPWSSLTHAHGPASDVPDLIRGMASPDPEAQMDAFDGLYETLCQHQSVLSEATSHAIPFLLELIASPTVKNRKWALVLVGDMARAVGHEEAHAGLRSRAQRSSPEVKAALARERQWRQATRDAAREGLPLFLTLCASDEPGLRKAAARAVGIVLSDGNPASAAGIDAVRIVLKDQDLPDHLPLLWAMTQVVRAHAGVDARGPRSIPARPRPTAEEQAASREALVELWRAVSLWREFAESSDANRAEEGLRLIALLYRHAADTCPPDVHADALAARLAAQWTEQLATADDERRTATLVLGVGSLGRARPEVVPVLQRLADATTTPPPVRYLAALQLAELETPLSDTALQTLVDASDRPGRWFERVRKLRGWGDLRPMRQLERLGPAVIARAMPTLLRIVTTAGNYGVAAPRKILRIVFGGTKLPPGTTATDLTDAQHELLLAVANNGAFWTRLDNDRVPLERFGLPNDRQRLRDFLTRPGEPRSRPSDDPAVGRQVLERFLAENMMPPGAGEPMPFGGPSVKPPAREGPRQRITELHLCGYASDAVVAHLRDYPRLADLDLDQGEVTDAGLVHIAALPELTALDLDGNPVTDAGLAHLARLTRLTSLSVRCHALTDAGLAHLAGLPNLRILHLEGDRLTGEGLVHLAGLTQLEELSLYGPSVTDAALAHLAALRNLQRLTFWATSVTGRGLSHLAVLAGLRVLEVHVAPLTDAGLLELPMLPFLQRLDLAETKVGDAGLAALSRLPKLGDLDLGGTAITDAGLAVVAGLRALKQLNLRHTAVTDAGLEHLHRLRKPDWIGLHETRVTAAGVGRLQEKFPQAAFDWMLR